VSYSIQDVENDATARPPSQLFCQVWYKCISSLVLPRSLSSSPTKLIVSWPCSVDWVSS